MAQTTQHRAVIGDLRTSITTEVPHLRRYARTLARNEDEADDLVQSCLEKAMKHSAQWDPDKGLRSWLFRILHNDFVSTLRKRQREREFRRCHPASEAHNGNQEDHFELQRVAIAMHRLPIEHREALILVGVSGLSYEEAARVLCIPVGTVRSRLSRARQRLRAAMKAGRANHFGTDDAAA